MQVLKRLREVVERDRLGVSSELASHLGVSVEFARTLLLPHATDLEPAPSAPVLATLRQFCAAQDKAWVAGVRSFMQGKGLAELDAARVCTLLCLCCAPCAVRSQMCFCGR